MTRHGTKQLKMGTTKHRHRNKYAGPFDTFSADKNSRSGLGPLQVIKNWSVGLWDNLGPLSA